MQNRIVLHYLDRNILKGSTIYFSPDESWFRFTNKGTDETSIVDFSKLKGIFFVRDFVGVPEYGERYYIVLHD